ncbi:MAG TPA: alpha/beta hydrolase [Acidimicrobiales bacterium]|nr:alpha/beta hydrolase [Acidimicrobiales bacterium]
MTTTPVTAHERTALELDGLLPPAVIRTPRRPKSVVRDVVLAERGHCRVRHLPGPPGARTVLLLHGWTATADLNWGRLYAALGRHYEVIAPDLRGHGGGVRGRFSLEACADDAAALLSALGRGPAILVGYSLGGPVATLMWRRHPGLVAGLVLCSTAGSFAETTREHLFLSAIGGLRRMTGLVGTRFRGALRTMVGGRLAGAEGGFSELVVGMMSGHDPLALCQAAIALQRYRADTWLSSISVPSAVVMTTRDHLVPPYRQLHLASAIPGCSLFPAEGDHAVCATRPERFLSSLLAALGDVARRAAPRPLGASRVQIVA